MISTRGAVALVVIVGGAVVGTERLRRMANQKPKEGGFVLSSNKSGEVVGVPQNALVVGGTAGIGKGLTQALLKRGVKVTIVGRNEPKDLKGVKFVKADLSSMKVARETVDKLKGEKFDAIVFTQGIFPSSLSRTSEGIESDLAVSYLSRYVMINEFLADGLGEVKLESGRKPRVFVMGFPGADNVPALEDVNWEKSYDFMPAHMNTVVFNEAIVSHFAKKYSSVDFFGLNPGFIPTDIRKDILHPALSPVLEGILGLVFPSTESYAEKVLVPLLGHPGIKSGALINQQGVEIEPNPWFKADHDGRVAQIVSITDELLKKHNLA